MRFPQPPLFPSIWRYALVYHGLFLLLFAGIALVSLSSSELTINTLGWMETSFSMHSTRSVSVGGGALALPGILACIWPALHFARRHPDAARSRRGLLRLVPACAIGSSPWWLAIQALLLITVGWLSALIGVIVMSILFFFHVLSIGAACEVTVAMERKLHA